MKDTPHDADPAALVFGPGGPEDYPAIEALLAQVPTPGSIRLAQEPDLVAGAAHPDALTHFVVGRDGDTIVATASCMTMPTPQGPVTWIGGLRVVPEYRDRAGVMRTGLAAIRAHLLGERPDWQLAILPKGALAGNRLLTAKRENFPNFTPLNDYTVFVFRPTRSEVDRVRRADSDDARPIAAYLATDPRPLSPLIGEHEKFHEWRDLEDDDFLLAEDGGRLTGVVALWDQRPSLRWRVRGYAPALRAGRLFHNLRAALTKDAALPRIGARLNCATLGFLTADTPDIACDLIRAALDRAAAGDVSLVTLGLSVDDPLHAVVAQTFRHQAYDCTIYGVTWPGGRDLPPTGFFDGARVELALL